MSTAEGGGNIVNDGLVLCLDAANTKSYVSGSTTWNDLSRGNNNGTLVNDPTFSSSNGGSIVFDGTNDYVGVSKVNAMSSFTLSFWFNIISFLGESRLLYVSNNSQSPGFRSDMGNKLIWWDGSLAPGVYGLGTTTLQTNTNYNATYVRNNTTGIKTIYLNTQIEFAGAVAGFIFSNVDFSQGIGFNGKIFSTLIYNRALSAQEILQNYNATKNRFGL